jgi:hypothetical protein
MTIVALFVNCRRVGRSGFRRAREHRSAAFPAGSAAIGSGTTAMPAARTAPTLISFTPRSLLS